MKNCGIRHKLVTAAVAMWIVGYSLPTSLCAGGPAEAEARAVLRASLLHRQRIKSGHVQLRVTHPVNAQDYYEKAVLEFDIHFDGDRIRSKVDWIHPKFGTRTTKTLVDGESYVNDTGIEDRRAWIAPMGEKYSFRRIEAFDPRLLGLIHRNLFGYYRSTLDYESVFWFDPERTFREKAESTTSDGIRLVHFKFEPRPKDNFEVVVCPEQDDSIVALITRSSDNGSRGEFRVDVDNKQYPAADGTSVWFPAKIRKFLTIDGVVKSDQVVEVTNAEFGPVEDGTFTMQTLDLPKGREMIRKENAQLMVWDGEKARPMTLTEFYAKKTSPPPEEPRLTAFWIWIINGTALLVLAIAVLVRSWRSKSS